MGIYLVTKNNLKRSYNEHILFIFILILPIILILLGSFINQMSSPKIRVGVLVKEDTSLYTGISSLFNQSKGIQYNFANPGSVHTDLITEKYHVVFDYSESEEIKDFKMIYYYNSVDEETKNQLKASIANGIPINLGQEQKESITRTQRMVAFLLTLLMITSTFNASNLIKDRNIGTLTRYCYAPKTVSSYIGGNVCYNVLLGTFQIGFSLFFMKLFQIPFGLSIKYALIIGVFIVCVATAFGTFITVISRSEMKANITASSITVLFSIIGGTFVSVEHMPNLLKMISIVSPIRWIIDMTKSMENGTSVLNQGISYVVLIGVIVLLYIATVAIVKRNKVN